MQRRTLIPALLLAVIILAGFTGVAGNGFVPYDDDRYVTENPAVLDGLTAAGLRWAFASVGYASNWHPLTWLSHMADVQLFGLNPGRHHLMNLALHLGGCLLLFQALQSATGRPWRSFFAIALFAVHPLRVESVAWVAERKDVLAFFFAMAVLAAWFSWRRRPGLRRRYALVAGVFIAGLLAKPSLLSLPLVLPLMAVWPGGAAPVPRGNAFPLRGILTAGRGAAPLLVPAAAVAVIVLLAQRAGGGLLDRAAPSLGLRTANALIAPIAYLGQTLLPRDLAAFYPFPAAIPAGKVIVAVLLLTMITAAAWVLRRRHPYLAVGWLWYLALLVPALGLIPVGGQAMADRYTYLPSVGLAVAGVWLAADLTARRRILLPPLVAAGAALILAFLPLTRNQVRVWRDGESLFTQALVATGDNWLIEHEFGVFLFNARRFAEAEVHLRAALRLQPDYVLAHYNLGGLLYRQGRAADAAQEYRQVVRLRPDFAEGHFRLARALTATGDRAEALVAYEEALRLDPGHGGAAAGRRKVLTERTAAGR